MKQFWLCFVPLFVAVDAPGVLPMFLGLTEGLPAAQKRRILIQSLITASAVAIVFLAGGPEVLRLVGVSVPDFMVAGGLLLLVISLRDILSTDKSQRRLDYETLGAVPIGVPLIVGPAVLTTCVLLANEHGAMLTAIAALGNIGIAVVVFWFAEPIAGFLGNAGTKTLSKIASLFLASIAVMLIRRGAIEIVRAA